MKNRFICAEEVAQELSVSKPYAYKLIRQLNEELKAKAVSKEEIYGQRTMRKVEQKMKKTIFEEMDGTYVRCGDYLIPNLTLPEEEESRVVGVWGQRHLRYLKEYRRTVYLDLLMSGRLNSYLQI